MRPLFAALLLVLPAAFARADTTTTQTTHRTVEKILCPDAKLWGKKLITGICWSCVFPVRLAGVTLGRSGDGPDDANPVPISFCSDRNGIPKLCITGGLWAPAHLVEIVRRPYCSPTLGGTVLQESVRLWGGHHTTEQDAADKTFYNYHYWAFPLYMMMELLIQSNCNAGGYKSLDLMYLSEVDPLWNEDELAFFLNPEAAMFANPAALAACGIDCGAASAGKPSETLFWCAGCWGNLYPFTGNIASEMSPPRDTSLLAARVIAGLHRRGLAWKTTGSDALCGGKIHPLLPKQQYRLSTLFPVTEARPDCCHYIGESTFTWGEWRTVPGTGEDYVYLLWRYTDCCLL